MKLRQLEMALQRCAGFEKPRAAREQYQTPATLAARLLYDAFVSGDIAETAVTDLGCGTGILAIGAALLGAETVRGIDLDPDALRTAEKNAALLGAEVNFIVADLGGTGKDAGWACTEEIGPCDTVVMNPPFGAQKQNVHADRPFIDCALAIAPVTYGIFNAGSTPFVEAYIAGRGRVAGRVAGTFPLKRSFAFHTRDVQEIAVEILRIVRT
ncbi:METTL5 family protein [Methanoregula sp.]|uniref:METTL5 family protein n=1 Tax=Methanoregula sp. TaxID=2052170 RepID=UPI002D031319|nr:METTL5 family protein [Methanoregula sp.]HVP97636.1 METTL5 family protein [Methanoregula sp.]